jgi:hypothetical protein
VLAAAYGIPQVYRLGSFTFWLLMLLLVADAAHADQGGIRYEHWQDINGWHGQTRTQSSTTDWDAHAPRGEQKFTPEECANYLAHCGYLQSGR